MTNDLSEMIAVMTAAKEGKPIQFLRRSIQGDHWMCASSPTWDWDSKEYRVKPPEPTPRQLRLENNAKLKAEYAEKPFRVEFKLPEESDDNWHEGIPGWCPDLDYRRKPAPPWSFETAPDMQKIRRKSDGALYIAVFYPDCVKIGGGDGWNQTIDYQTLLRDFEALDGGICGITKEAK